MFPFITIIGKTIGMYQIAMLVGIFTAGIYVCRLCTKNGYDDSDGINFLLLVSMGVFVGGRILYSIVNYQAFIYVVENITRINSFNAFLNTVYLIWGGNVFYGGLLGGILTAIIIFKKRPQWRYLLDFVVPAIPLFHFFGRIGCFLAGCCFGIKSSFGFNFRHSIVEEANGINRFPVQLLEAFINLLLFFILDILRRKNLFKQNIIYLYLLLYSVARFFIEFLRGDEYRGFFFNLSTSQIISILIFCFIIPKIYSLFRHNDLLYKQKTAHNKAVKVRRPLGG
ncbi:prolipoprotein diacylglyceryl transferase [Treponema sp. R6D11]